MCPTPLRLRPGSGTSFGASAPMQADSLGSPVPGSLITKNGFCPRISIKTNREVSIGDTASGIPWRPARSRGQCPDSHKRDDQRNIWWIMNDTTLIVGLIILAFVAGGGVGYLLASQNTPGTVADDRCPAEITSRDALTVALHDPEVVGLLGNKSIDTIAFSKGSYPERNVNYTQVLFRLGDPDPDDRMTAPMIVVQVNESCMVYSVYKTYPSYIPRAPPEA